MIYYRDKVLNNLFEDKVNSDIIQKTLNYISQNPLVGEDETLADIVQKVYKDGKIDLLDIDTSTKNKQKQTDNNYNNVVSNDNTIISNVEQVDITK